MATTGNLPLTLFSKTNKSTGVRTPGTVLTQVDVRVSLGNRPSLHLYLTVAPSVVAVTLSTKLPLTGGPGTSQSTGVAVLGGAKDNRNNSTRYH